MLTYQELIKNIGYKRLSKKYDASYDSFINYLKDKDIDLSYFIDKDYLLNLKNTLDLSDEVYEYFLSHLDTFNNNKDLVLTSHYLKYLLFYFEEPSLNDIFQSPKCKLYQNDVFEAFVLMSIVLERIDALRKRGMKNDVLKPRLGIIKRILSHHIRRDYGNFRWASFDFYINLFNAKALSFMIPYVFDANIHIFRSKNNKTIILAGSGERIRKDGQLDGVNGIKDYAFTTSYKETKKEYIGYYIDPKGFYTDKIMKLDKNEWNEFIKEGDYILEMHVGGHYKYEDNILAFKEAIAFAHQYFSEYDFKAIYGYSWLFSPQIPQLISNESSNILRMFKTGYIVPCSSGEKLAFDFIYEDPDMTIDKMPTNTTLLKNIKDFYLQGNRINCGMYFLMIDDIDKIDDNVYQK
ncbi:MAG: hypothetical protein J6Y42_01580 [Bacilli bacterium]|nr:hypothetical protein [Bacilli bacterium]